MATITLTAGANTKSWTISAGDIQRILDAVNRDAGQIEDPPGSGIFRNRTAAECFTIIASRFETSLREMTKISERNATAIADVAMT